MKKIIAIALVLAMMLVLIPAGSVFADKTDTVTITMTGGNLSIDVTPDAAYDFGSVVQDASYITASATAEYTVNNDGTVQADIAISGEDSDTWALQANPGTPDIYALDFQRAADLGVWHEITTVDATYMDDLNNGSADTFGLQLWTPVTISAPGAETAIITFTASQSLVAGPG